MLDRLAPSHPRRLGTWLDVTGACTVYQIRSVALVQESVCITPWRTFSTSSCYLSIPLRIKFTVKTRVENPKCSCRIHSLGRHTLQPHVCPGRDLLRLSIRALSAPLTERWRRRLRGLSISLFRSSWDIPNDTILLDISFLLDRVVRAYQSNLHSQLCRRLRHVQGLQQTLKIMCSDQFR